jgi:dihydrofolate synthase/folylpolyglutamate synthase
MNYSQILDYLYSVNTTRGVKLGLENPQKLDQSLNFPSQSFPAIHVAGTNGKGSVCVKMAKALELTGKKVGLFTSPHISSFRERIKINGKMISEEAVCRLLTPLIQGPVPATFFELTTLLCFLWFREEKVDIAVLETGLGGRLDATNICRPILTIITSIDFDHTHVLGKTLDAIAREKYGIHKNGIPMILGTKTHHLKGIKLDGVFDSTEEENRAIARLALEELEIPQEAIQEGLEASLPCRFEKINYRGKQVICDVAHNPAGLTRLFERVKESPAIVFGLSKDKDIVGCIQAIKAHGAHFFPIKANHERGTTVSVLKEELLKAGVPNEKITCAKNLEEALDLATTSNRITVACGTFFIMRELRQALGIDEPRDFWELNEKKV